MLSTGIHCCSLAYWRYHTASVTLHAFCKPAFAKPARYLLAASRGGLPRPIEPICQSAAQWDAHWHYRVVSPSLRHSDGFTISNSKPGSSGSFLILPSTLPVQRLPVNRVFHLVSLYRPLSVFRHPADRDPAVAWISCDPLGALPIGQAKRVKPSDWQVPVWRMSNSGRGVWLVPFRLAVQLLWHRTSAGCNSKSKFSAPISAEIV